MLGKSYTLISSNPYTLRHRRKPPRSFAIKRKQWF